MLNIVDGFKQYSPYKTDDQRDYCSINSVRKRTIEANKIVVDHIPEHIIFDAEKGGTTLVLKDPSVFSRH